MDAHRPDDRVASPRLRRDDPPAVADPVAGHAAPPSVATFEWVFGSNTVLGGVAAGCRDLTHNGQFHRYAPWRDLGGGARWCSQPWLERCVGTRGNLARNQGVHSRMGMHLSGAVTSGTVVVIPEEQLDTAADLAARSLARGRDDTEGLREWSTAIVRHPGRSRLALRIDPISRDVYDQTLAVFATELDVEWFVQFSPGHDRFMTGGRTIATPDRCTIRAVDGTVTAELEGLIYLEYEPIPTRLVEIAERFGNGLALVGRPSPAIHVPNDSYRPLESDETDIDSD